VYESVAGRQSADDSRADDARAAGVPDEPEVRLGADLRFRQRRLERRVGDVDRPRTVAAPSAPGVDSTAMMPGGPPRVRAAGTAAARRARLVALAVAVVATLTAFAAAAERAEAGVRAPRSADLRPSDPRSEYAYRAPASAYAGTFAVVHYVTEPGYPDAPPPLDGNEDGIPDYVQTTALIADYALAHYEHPADCSGGAAPRCDPVERFRPVRPDCGGPDRRPDVYIKELGGSGREGLATTGGCAAGGPFVLVDPDLIQPAGGTPVHLSFVTAHELFHLVQFAYTREIDRWLAEGTANAMAAHFLLRLSVEEGIDTFDPAAQARFESWLATPWRPVFVTGGTCDPCYDSFVWWTRTLALNDGAVQDVMARIARLERGSRSASPAAQMRALERAFDTAARRRNRPRGDPNAGLHSSFAEVAREMFRTQFSKVGKLAPVTVTDAVRATMPRVRGYEPGSLGPLAIHYVPLRVPATARRLRVRVEVVTGTLPSASLMLPDLTRPGPLGVIPSRLVPAARSPARPRGRFRGALVMDTVFLDAQERRAPTLVITGRRSAARYRVVAIALS
jgi:hypothetical protein